MNENLDRDKPLLLNLVADGYSDGELVYIAKCPNCGRTIMVDRIRPYVIIYEQKFEHETEHERFHEYTKFCTLKELIEEIGALYKDPFITNVMYYEIMEEE